MFQFHMKEETARRVAMRLEGNDLSDAAVFAVFKTLATEDQANAPEIAQLREENIRLKASAREARDIIAAQERKIAFLKGE